MFVQDQWTAGRVTLQGALRFDHSSQLVPRTDGRAISIPSPIHRDSRNERREWYKDITPRMGVAYDLFGNGRTAVKANLGKYLEGQGNSNNWANANPTTAIPLSPGVTVFGPPGVTRTWTDRNSDFKVDCDLLDPNAQIDHSGFLRRAPKPGLRHADIRPGTSTPRLLTGWGVRASDWTLGASVQQQLSARSSVEVAYTRRWYRGFTVTDNLATSNSDISSTASPRPGSTAPWRRRVRRLRTVRHQSDQVWAGQ